MKCYAGKKITKKRNTDCNVNDAGISDNSCEFALLLKNIRLQRNIQQQDGFQPPSYKIDALIYIKSFHLPRRFITE